MRRSTSGGPKCPCGTALTSLRTWQLADRWEAPTCIFVGATTRTISIKYDDLELASNSWFDVGCSCIEKAWNLYATPAASRVSGRSGWAWKCRRWGIPPSGCFAPAATSRSGVRRWGKMFVIRRFWIKTEMKHSAKKRERTLIKRKRREECVCVCVCVCVHR